MDCEGEDCESLDNFENSNLVLNSQLPTDKIS